MISRLDVDDDEDDGIPDSIDPPSNDKDRWHPIKWGERQGKRRMKNILQPPRFRT
jgi:hypothetical protein